MYRTEPGGQGLYGRRNECDRLEHMLAEIRTGQSQVLVLRGDAGIGKTALLDHVASRASGCTVARAIGVESEMELPFAGLHQLCAPFLDRLGKLPPPQRDALAMVFGLRDGSAPDRFLIALAVLSLLSDAAEDRPLVCLVDDMQWLDQASADTLAFVARRLLAESVALVFATRTSGEDRALRALPELPIGGLTDVDARAVLRTALRSPSDQSVLDEIVAEARGNPLALLELPRGRTPAEIAFGFGLASTLPLVSRMEQGFLRQLAPLPDDTRRLLLVAAVEPVGDPILLWQAAGRLGVEADAAIPAEAAELIEIGSRVRFRHPLLRSAVFRAAAVEDLRKVHAALAGGTDLDPDRRAWHRAQATPGPDEEIATELERSADRARARGGLAAAATFLDRAATLTPNPDHRVQRALAAAHAKLQAGEFDQASELLVTAESGPLEDLVRARIALLRARIAFASDRNSEAPQLLLTAARRLQPLDLALARETYLDAFSAAMFAGRFTTGPGLAEVAQAVRQAPTHGRHRSDLLLEGLAVLFTEGYAAATPLGRRALQAFRSEDISGADELRFLWIASIAAADMWDDDSWHVLSIRHVRLARESGALGELPLALNSRIVAVVFAGDLAAAAALVEEAKAVVEATGSNLASYGALVHAALQGREAQARDLIDTTLKEVVQRGEGIGATVAYWTTALLLNGLGRYEEALAPARLASEYPLELAASNWGLVELVEAAMRSGETDLASNALDRLTGMTQATGTNWALGIELRSRALVSADDTAEGLYRQAINHLGRSRAKIELARAHLLYGEWLRRQGRRNDAREQLRAAHEQFTAMGVEGFGERARRELMAAGETARMRPPDAREDLTAQETEIARLASTRRTNSEIGAQLFISPRTVEWHLRKVFTKLGVSSRKELYDALPEDGRISALS